MTKPGAVTTLCFAFGLLPYESSGKDVRIQNSAADDMQFGFMKGKETTDATFIVRQMQKNFRVKGKKLYSGFVDLEKSF